MIDVKLQNTLIDAITDKIIEEIGHWTTAKDLQESSWRQKFSQVDKLNRLTTIVYSSNGCE